MSSVDDFTMLIEDNFLNIYLNQSLSEDIGSIQLKINGLAGNEGLFLSNDGSSNYLDPKNEGMFSISHNYFK